MEVTPPGCIPRLDAVDKLGCRLGGKSWPPFPTRQLDPLDLVRDVDAIDAEAITAKLNLYERVITTFAEHAASGELVCARFTDTGGVKALDPGEFRSLGWRRYFVPGKVTLLVPLHDEQGNPMLDHRGNPITVRGRYDIFVERKGLERLIATLPEPGVEVEAEGSVASTAIDDDSEPASSPTERVIPKWIVNLVTRYLRKAGPKATLRGVRVFAHDSGIKGHRDEIDAEFRNQRPDRRLGRPPKRLRK
jgi:hypothetical protein